MSFKSFKPIASCWGVQRTFTTFMKVPVPHGAVKVDCMDVPMYIGHASSRAMLPTNEDRYTMGFMEFRDMQALGKVGKVLQSRIESRGTNVHGVPMFVASVFDGHGGTECAEFLAKTLHGYVETVDTRALAAELPAQYAERFGRYWTGTSLWRPGKTALFNLLKLAYLKADLDSARVDLTSGSTSTSTYIYSAEPTSLRNFWEPQADINLVTAQVGDSRAILCDTSGNTLSLTSVHHADNARERRRLREFKEYIQYGVDGRLRFMQYLNTRSFGDMQAKPLGLSAEPEIGICRIRKGECESLGLGPTAFLVLMSDGVSDHVTDQELCDLVISRAQLNGSLQDAADDIVNYALHLGAFDNTTALVIRLGGWGAWRWRDKTAAIRNERLQTARVEK